MAGGYDNNLSGVLFVNDKGDNEKRPDWKGSAEINGEHFWVSGWARSGAKGELISLKFELKDAAKAATSHSVPKQEKAAAAVASYAGDDDIPF